MKIQKKTKLIKNKIEPYYQDKQVKIYNNDCCDILSYLEPADLVLTDPPFFVPAVHYQSRIRWQKSFGDGSILRHFLIKILDLVKLKDTGHFLIFCNGNSYSYFYEAMFGYFDNLKCLVWDKMHFGLGRIWRHQHELIICGTNHKSFVNTNGKSYSDILKYKATSPTKRQHPVEKPISLLCNLIEPITPHNGLVLDMFMGSGTTLIAARNLQRRAIGIEIEKKYCEIAKGFLSQQWIFHPETL